MHRGKPPENMGRGKPPEKSAKNKSQRLMRPQSMMEEITTENFWGRVLDVTDSGSTANMQIEARRFANFLLEQCTNIGGVAESDAMELLKDLENNKKLFAESEKNSAVEKSSKEFISLIQSHFIKLLERKGFSLKKK